MRADYVEADETVDDEVDPRAVKVVIPAVRRCDRRTTLRAPVPGIPISQVRVHVLSDPRVLAWVLVHGVGARVLPRELQQQRIICPQDQ